MISIIIATYNRACFLEQTMLSIQNQTYTDFECIIVDDGSTDDTALCVEKVIRQDSRFLYVIRPDHVPKGANYSRNYGYSLSKGDYIKFFDSDDLMLVDHLQISIEQLKKGNYDFVVGDCINFDQTGLLSRPYEIDRETAVLSAMNFVDFTTGWITDDLLVKRKFADKIDFASGMRDQASEYQFNIKLLMMTTNGLLLDRIITHRRLHDGGIVMMAQSKKYELSLMGAEMYYRTAREIEKEADSKMIKWLLRSHIKESFYIASARKLPENILGATSMLLNYYGLRGLLYPFAIMSALLTGKGYVIMKLVYD